MSKITLNKMSSTVSKTPRPQDSSASGGRASLYRSSSSVVEERPFHLQHFLFCIAIQMAAGYHDHLKCQKKMRQQHQIIVDDFL